MSLSSCQTLSFIIELTSFMSAACCFDLCESEVHKLLISAWWINSACISSLTPTLFPAFQTLHMRLNVSSLYAQTHRLSCLPISTMAISCSDTVSWRAAYFSWSSACSCLDHTSHMTIYLNSMHRTKHSKFEPHLFE